MIDFHLMKSMKEQISIPIRNSDCLKHVIGRRGGFLAV